MQDLRGLTFSRMPQMVGVLALVIPSVQSTSVHLTEVSCLCAQPGRQLTPSNAEGLMSTLQLVK